MQKWKRYHELLYLGLAIFLTALLCATNAQALTNTVFSETGNYSVYAKGVGLNNPSAPSTSGTIQMFVTGTPVKSYLYWVERDLTPPVSVLDVDSTITFQDGANPPVELAATQITSDVNGFCFRRDITGFVEAGPNSFTVSGLDNERNPGAGILVITADDVAPLSKLTVLDGCDFFYFGIPGQENSEVITFNVGSSTADRTARITLFVADAQTDAPPITLRGNEILYLSSVVASTATPSSPLASPPAISLGKNATGLVNNDGDAWDTFGRDSGLIPPVISVPASPDDDPDQRGLVTIKAGDGFANVQIISPASVPPGIGEGISAIIPAAALQVFVEREGCTPGYWKQPQHFDSWPSTYEPSTLFEAVFGRDVPGNPTLLQALKLNGGGLNALMRHSAAALLNAASSSVGYAYTVTEVITMFRTAFDSGNYENTKNLFDTANNAGCPLD